ncbi:MAG: EamA family transporter [Deltaproteobacteria bacterium]|nr:EamA family transporter [Deltaproteobacteria bacterium]
MAPLPLLLVLGSALLHALWNHLLKGHPTPEQMVAPVIVLATLLSFAVALAQGALSLPPGALPFTLLAGLGEGAYFATLARALALSPLGQVYALSRGGALLLVWPVSLLWLGEPLSLVSLAGAGGLAGGLVLCSFERGRGPRVGRGLLFAAASAVAIAGYHLCYKQALGLGAPPALVFSLSLTLGVCVPIYRLARPRARVFLEVVRGAPFRIALAGLSCGGSFLLLLTALASSGAGAVVTLRNTSVLYAQLFALVGGERPSRRQWLGVLLVAAGAVTLGVGGR